MLVTLDEIRAAADRIRGTALQTPLLQLDLPNLPFELYAKCESAQPIGSFKLRGAYNMIAQLAPGQLQRGVITYSSGNHAQGVAYGARAKAVKAVIVMPDNAPTVKIEATRALGAEIVFVGPASSARRERAEQLAAEHGYTIIPPYDHPHIIAGQATCGLEIAHELPDADLVLAPVSGGGLLSGTATALKLAAQSISDKPAGLANPAGLVNPALQVWGAEPALAADARESFYTRTLVEWPAALTSRTLGDGLRTQSLGQLNFEHILRFVDGIVAVSEEEIVEAIRVFLRHTAIVPEPSGAVTLAAALFHAHELPAAKKVVVVVSGGNIEPSLLRSLRSEVALQHV